MQLQQNVGTIDRIARIGLAVILGATFVTGVVAAPFSWLALGLAGVMVATAVTGFCPIYAVLGIRTCPIQRT